MFSTMITVASTMQPEVEGADGEQVRAISPRSDHEADGKESAKGMVAATTSAAAEVAEEQPLEHEDERDTIRRCCASRSWW